MQQLKTIMRNIRTAARLTAPLIVLAIAFWSQAADSAWAKKSTKVVEEVVEKSYMLPYAIVILCAGLGLMMICRPSRRLDEAMRKQEEDE